MRQATLLLIFVVGVVGACARPRAGGVPDPKLPAPPGPFAPSFASVDGPVTGAEIADVESCGGCHGEVLAEWKTSAHANASFSNPIYRLSVERLRKDRGNQASRFCGGCHDIALTVDGALDADVRPDDPRADAGVTCRTCHSIVHTTSDGNGSWTLTGAPIPYPTPREPGSREAHIARVYGDELKKPELCASCHKVFLDEGTGNEKNLPGQDDATPYFRSVYAGSLATMLDEPVVEKTCQDCHMARTEATHPDLAAKDGLIASHRFLGGHTWLAAMRGDPDAEAREAAMLRGAVSIDVAVAINGHGERTLPADGAPLAPGDKETLDVVVRNLGVGHRFPGGTLDAQDTWIEVDVRDANGALVASQGVGDDADAHRMRATIVGDDGMPLLTRETHLFRAVVSNHTLAARDAEVVEYAFTVPPSPALPFRVTARLQHRSRNAELVTAACAASHSAYDTDAAAFGKQLDGCATPPITEIASVEIPLGGPGERISSVETPTWKRLFEHGLGILHALSERLDEARPSLNQALALLPESATRERAMVLAALADLAGREGRVDEALELVDRAEQLVPDHPALARIRGDALAQVWRWKDALAPLAAAASGAPKDDLRWDELSTALGSAGRDVASLDAAVKGLSLQPRDADLLRCQSLSLDRLKLPQAPDALQAYLERRPADDAPKLKNMCQLKVPGCALERNPVHVHEMKMTTP